MASKRIRPPSLLQAEKSSVTSISKAFAILRLIGDNHSPLTLTDIARNVGLTPSSCHDLVTTLVQIGYVQPSSVGKSYEIGPRLVRLAKRALIPVNDLSEAQRRMNAISERYNVNLSVLQALQGSKYISTQVSEGSAPIRIRLSPGQEFPILRGAPGKFFSAYNAVPSPAQKGALFEIGIASKRDAAKFLAEVAEDKKRGWSTDVGLSQPGIASIAVPILGGEQRLLGVIEVVMFQKQFESAPIDIIAHEALDLSKTLAGALDRRLA